MRFEDGADVELRVEGVLDADLDVVEVDEYCDVQSFLMSCQTVDPSVRLTRTLRPPCGRVATSCR